MRKGTPAATFAQGRLKVGEMNATEKKYNQYLEQRKIAGEILWYKFEGVKLRLADNTFYTVDYFVMLADGVLEAHEVKGNWQDDARLKIKIAQEMYPFRFIAVKVVPASRGGGWEVEDFENAQQPLLPGMRLKADVPKPKPRVAPSPGINPFDDPATPQRPERRIR
jgi:hypothetical protein